MRVAIVHDFLYTMRGAERVLDAFCELLPNADLFSLIYRKGTLNPRIENRRIISSPVNLLPGNHRWWLALYPWAISRFDLSGYDLVLSSSYAVAKGVEVPEETPHVCYCHTPMRYIWDMYEEYFHASRLWQPFKTMIDVTAELLRAWDVRTSSHVDAFIANSTTVAARIRRIYRRDSTIIHPPADAEYFTPAPVPREDWYLCASAFSPYKRADLVIEAFRKSGRKLKVVGAGQDEVKIRKMCGGAVEFLGWLPDEGLRDMYRRGRGLIFAGEEDFGILPVEAQLCGMPVVAFGKGGLLDSIVDRETGVFFGRQTVESLNDAVDRFEASDIRPDVCRRNGERFSRPRFMEAMRSFLDRTVAEFKAKRSSRQHAGSPA